MKIIKGLILIISLAGCLFGQNVPGHIYILYTNDIHGALSPSVGWWINPNFPPPIGNAPAAVSFIKEKRDEAEKNNYGFLLLDAGDMFQGTPIGEFSRGRVMVDYYNYADYDAITVGNHDYDFGVDELKWIVKKTKAAFLGANVVKAGSTEIVDYLKPYIILRAGDLRIGIFGITTQYLKSMTTPDRFQGQDVLNEVETARHCVAALKDSGVDLIIGLTHIGYKHDRVLADSVVGIDLIIGGHSHTGLERPFEDSINHTLIFQTYGKLTCLGFIDLEIDPGRKIITGFHSEIVDLLAEEIEDDTVMVNILRQWELKTMKGFQTVIGLSKRPLLRSGMEESALGNLITDALREYFKSDIAIHNSGGIRADLPAGEITYRDCYNIDGFSNTAVLMNVPGRILREMLEISVNGHHAIFQISGLKMRYDSRKLPNNRLLEVVLEDGSVLDDNKVYKVVTNSYLASGSGEYRIFKEAQDVEDTYTYLRDIIADYIRRHSPVDRQVEGRIVDISKNR